MTSLTSAFDVPPLEPDVLLAFSGLEIFFLGPPILLYIGTVTPNSCQLAT